MVYCCALHELPTVYRYATDHMHIEKREQKQEAPSHTMSSVPRHPGGDSSTTHMRTIRRTAASKSPLDCGVHVWLVSRGLYVYVPVYVHYASPVGRGVDVY